MREGSARLVGEDIGQLLKSDLEVLGGIDISGDVGGVPPDMLGARVSKTEKLERRGLDILSLLTRSWLYSFSKRCLRRIGSLAASLLEPTEANGAMRRDHW